MNLRLAIYTPLSCNRDGWESADVFGLCVTVPFCVGVATGSAFAIGYEIVD